MELKSHAQNQLGTQATLVWRLPPEGRTGSQPASAHAIDTLMAGFAVFLSRWHHPWALYVHDSMSWGGCSIMPLKPCMTSDIVTDALTQERTGAWHPHATHAEIRVGAFEYIEAVYNRKRQHSTLGDKSPVRFLENWMREQHQERRAARNPPVGRRKTEGSTTS